jgi:hypothetical protein
MFGFEALVQFPHSYWSTSILYSASNQWPFKAFYGATVRKERKEAEQEKFNNIPEKVQQNGMVQRMVERVHEIQDAEVLDMTW